MSGTRNALFDPTVVGQAPQNQLAPQPTWADAASWHGQNLSDTWAAMQQPQTWVDAAQQYGNALIMGTTAPEGLVRVLSDGSIMRGASVVGRVKYNHGDSMTRIADIQVNPSAQNQGVGTSAIQQIQAEAASRGNPVVLSTDAFRGKQAQADQLRLYQRLGFAPNTGADAVSEMIGGKRVKEELVWHPLARGQ